MDSEMGLNYFCQRYYDPQIGRFMTLDPQDSPASSPYAYCANNPLKFTDPTGEKSMSDTWIEWQMQDDAAFWGTMGQGGFNPYSGWVPKNWFLGSSAELDPDFWAKGWDWTVVSDVFMTAAQRTQILQAVYQLSSGIYDIDVITENGLVSINPGQFLKENWVNIKNSGLSELAGNTSPSAPHRMLIALQSLATKANGSDPNIYDLMSVILHETVHLIQYSYGFQAVGYKLKTLENLHNAMERQAYAVQGYFFGNRLSEGFLKDWITGARECGLMR